MSALVGTAMMAAERSASRARSEPSLQTIIFITVWLVYRLAYNGDVAAGQLAVFQGGPSRTGGKAPISGFIRADPPRRRKNSQLAAARRVALKMGRRPSCSSVTY